MKKMKKMKPRSTSPFYTNVSDKVKNTKCKIQTTKDTKVTKKLTKKNQYYGGFF
jgi:hypothetical protein